MPELWTDKHKPEQLGGIFGQAEALKEIVGWLEGWKPGKGILLAGPPGIGKTLVTEVLAKERNLLLLQMNASDVRNPEAIEGFLGETSKGRPLFHRGKIILVDEADGISGRDRGAAGAIAKLIKESRFPVFLTVNNLWNQKLASVRPLCKIVKMRKVHMYDIMKALKAIAEKEGIELEGNTPRMLAQFASGDLRSAVNDLQTVAEGKKVVSEKDLEALGYRERIADIFRVLPTIFHSKSISASRKAIMDSDKDSDEIFLWIETNLPMEFKDTEALANGYELLAKADIFRKRVVLRQNWRFKAYMQDLMAGISLLKGETRRTGFAPYQPPDRIVMLGRSKGMRAIRGQMLKKLGTQTHCSMEKAKAYLPYLRILKKKQKGFAERLGLEKEEAKLL